MALRHLVQQASLAISMPTREASLEDCLPKVATEYGRKRVATSPPFARKASATVVIAATQ
eukprot:6179415-Pleurochrysis_carterae.AAC.2